MTDRLLVKTLREGRQERIPFWFMRQAGRYLPKYRALRSQFPDFLSFCYTPEAATEATLQPIARYDMDAAIIFSDILVIPHALGMDVRFEQGHGPAMTPLSGMQGFEALCDAKLEEFLSPVYRALAQTRKKLASEKTLIGFCGSPWTLACYMLQGRSSENFAQAITKARQEPEFFAALLSLLEHSVVRHASAQVAAGADVIQLFDSWAGLLDAREFEAWVIAPTKRIVQALKQRHPQLPIIGFPRQAGEKALAFARDTGVACVGMDNTASLEWMATHLQPECCVQGVLENTLLAGDQESLLSNAKKIISVLSHKAFVFNLAHGVLPHTPPDNVQALSELIKSTRLS